MARRNDKRARLIEAADKLFHEQGVNVTTLANIAQLADVPLGNVYYYFKSKDSITLAVIEYRRAKLKALFNEFEQQVDPRSRLLSLVRHGGQTAEESPAFGDALGSLCQELSKQEGELATGAAGLMREVLNWVETQFRNIGKQDESTNLALSFVAGLQGMNLLNLTFKDKELLQRQVQQLSHFVQTV
jgi:TetR/AcrR family transcriptional repressor of nem operon